MPAKIIKVALEFEREIDLSIGEEQVEKVLDEIQRIVISNIGEYTPTGLTHVSTYFDLEDKK